MKKTIFTGAGVALITPMKEDGSINFEELGRILDAQIEGGTDAVIICGTTGEPATMPDEEHLSCIEYAVQHVNHRIPVIAGTGSNDTRHGCELSRKAADLGADALLLVTPYYNKTTREGLVQHFKAITESAGLPCIVYNVPSRTGMNIDPETAYELAKNPLICGIKEASGNISQIAKTMALCGDELPLYSGNDDQIVPLLALGGKGVISVLSNVAPRQTHDICRLWFEGKTQESAALQLELLSLANSLFCEVNPIPVKYAMNLLGFKAGHCRLPLVDPTPAHQELIRKEMEKAGLI